MVLSTSALMLRTEVISDSVLMYDNHTIQVTRDAKYRYQNKNKTVMTKLHS